MEYSYFMILHRQDGDYSLIVKIMAKKINIKKGENLTVIAEREGISVDELFEANTANPFVKSRDLILEGGTLDIPDPKGTIKEDFGGIGTLTRTEKAPIETKTTEEEITPEITPTGEVSVEDEEITPEVPTFGEGEVTQTTITDAFKAVNKQIEDVERDILASKTPSEEEKQLLKDLQEKKASLRTFDTETLQRTESFIGTGRGRTTAFVGKQQAKERRVRALERLGLSQEAQTLVEELALERGERETLGGIASERLKLAGERLDLSLGLQRELAKFDEQEKSEARSFILDVIDFSEGKTFEELEIDIQQRIITSVADSPLTLSMVKTALENGAKGADRTLTVAEAKSLGVPFGTKVSEAEGITPKATDIIGDEDLDLTKTNQREIQQAGLGEAPENVQSYFLNTPSAFRDEIQRTTALGEDVPLTIEEMNDKYTVWFDEQNKDKDRDWADLLK